MFWPQPTEDRPSNLNPFGSQLEISCAGCTDSHRKHASELSDHQPV